MKKLLFLLMVTLFAVVNSFANTLVDSTVATKYSKKKIDLKHIKKAVKVIDKTFNKEVSGSDFVLLDDGTLINLVFKKYVGSKEVKSKVLTGKVSIDYIIGNDIVRETYYINKDGIVIKAVSESYEYKSKDKYDLTSTVEVYFINYKNPMFVLNGEKITTTQDVIDSIMGEMRSSLYGITKYFNK